MTHITDQQDDESSLANQLVRMTEREFASRQRAESAEAERDKLRELLREILKRYDLRGPASCTTVVLRNAIEVIRTALSTGDATKEINNGNNQD